MGRDKRKSRLDKGGATGGEAFVGFSAFAAPSTSLKASPVYTGSDAQLSLVFKRITQKRDAVTKVKALNDLQTYFEQDHNRKDQKDALAHLVFFYHAKINYDDASSVRAAAISCMNAACQRLPKAWKTLVLEQQPEVCGMLWCGRADPAAEVRVAAALYDGAVQKGVVQYVTRILGYDRPRIMHDALFARKQEPEPPDRDELDERYERIVGTALGGIDLWIQGHPETEESTYQGTIQDGILWSTLNSSKSSLRRKTYSLLATLCQHAKSLVYGEVGMWTLPKLLTNALTQEKDAINIPAMLEVLLLYLNNFPDGDPWKVVDAPLLVKNLGKQLKKACHGASASQWGPTLLPLLATLTDDTFALRLQLLKNMSTGMEAAIGPGDSLLIGAAIAECASFFLLRRETEALQMDNDVAKQFADYWLQILGQYLSSESATSMAKASDASLLQTLSESFFKLDESSKNRPNSAIYRIQDWFWNIAMETTVSETKGSISNQRWADLLNSVTEKRQDDEANGSLADPVIRKRFHATLSKYQGGSGSAPDLQGYNLMIASVRYCGAQYIFAEDEGDKTTLDHFLLNDLLRWIVMDTSSLSSRLQPSRLQRNVMVEFDFTLLRDCLLSVISPLKQKTIWETILRESIAAQCDLELLSEGLIVLSQKPATLGIIRCEELDDFAIKIGEETGQRYREHYLKEFVDDDDDDTYKEAARKTSLFLQTCVGLSPGSFTALVSQKVIHGWTKDAAASSEQVFELGGNVDVENPLVTTLLMVVSKGDVSLLTPDDADRIVLESWRRGGKQWSEDTVPLLLNQSVATDRQQLCSSEHIIRSGMKELQDLLTSFCGSSDSDLAHVALVCHVWSGRAFRILHLCSQVVDASNGDDLPPPSLAMIGLADVEVWQAALSGKASVVHLYLCLVYVLQQFDRQIDRLELLQSSDSSPALITNILLAISDASNGVIIDPVTRRDRRCAFILSLFGSSNLPNDLRHSWCRAMIDQLSTVVKSRPEEGVDRATRGVSVLSELLFSQFGRVVVDEGLSASTADAVVANDVREGDDLWYVTDEDAPRSKARVVKVHTDDFPRLYFTIRVAQGDGVAQERQTVAERLRRLPQPPITSGDAVIVSSVSESERAERVTFGDTIFEKVIKPALVLPLEGQERPFIDAASECVNIIVSHCGLIGKEGIASTRYEVFKLLSSLQSTFAQSLVPGIKVDNMEASLRALSLSMGIGNVAPASKSDLKLMKFCPNESVKAIVHYYRSEEVNINRTNELSRTALQWLIVAVGDLGEEAIRTDAVDIMYELAAAVLSHKGKSSVDELADSALVMRAVGNAEIAALSGLDEGASVIVGSDEQNIMTKLVKSFSCDWQSAAENVCQYQILDIDKRTTLQLPDWYEPFQSLVRTVLKQRSGAFAVAAKSNCDTLVENLFNRDKRWLAFRLLVACADGEPLHLDHYIGDATQQRLQIWQDGLVDEEAEELEEDVGLVGQWTPEAMMNELESWSETEDLYESGDVAAMGRMLCWLSFLSFVDSAAAVDVMFRGSVGAYLSYVDITSVLTTALSYLNLEKERNAKQKALITIQDALDDCSCLELSNIAGVVMFRTVEEFPTLFRHWWADDCPKKLTAAVTQFVETKIAPEALRRELARINNVSDLGEMTVSGSTVSREVTATYTQDECQLSIVIQLPPNFPLRNVEVDGRLTLGIPEKRWKRWALQIRQMLNNQDGTLLDALMLWKENVDKDFAGLEPCPVCYSILSVKTHELPNLECNTCKNCFHSSCLYKWFHSSGKSSCVLCQQPWSGTRIQRGAS